ncbi:MAG: hypothetical protein Q8J78_04515 [Moraxellaceae bacterium]|nr:hypothetical protein [Moraxellaceae bacterium]
MADVLPARDLSESASSLPLLSSSAYQSVEETVEEFMFAIDVPSVPVEMVQAYQSDEMVSVHQVAAAPGHSFDYVFTDCRQADHLFVKGDTIQGNVVDPARALLFGYFKSEKGVDIDLGLAKVTYLAAPANGKLFYLEKAQPFSYQYKPNPGFVGEDTAAFMVEYEGKRYKVVVTIVVREAIGNEDLCRDELNFQPKFIKVSSSKIGFSVMPEEGAALPAEYSWGAPEYAPITFTLADLPGQSLGLTSGTSITLDSSTDSNGAGHGWYFEWLGSGDDWLPTSDPQEWMARPGSAADGRMDVRIVFPHQYGHAIRQRGRHASFIG